MKRWRLRLIPIVFFLSACGRSMLYDTTIFEKYVQTFERESIVYGRPIDVVDLVIKFSETLPEDVVGRCHRNFNAAPLILINITWWEYLSVDEKEILLFHELGHCILGLAHSDNGAAIMNTHLLGGYGGSRGKLLSDYFKTGIDSLAAMRYSINRKAGYVPDRCTD